MADIEQPGTPLFQRHARCPWTLPTSSGALTHSSPLSSFRAHFSGESASPVHLQVPTSNTPSGPNNNGTTSNVGKKNKNSKNQNQNRNPSPSISDHSDSSEIKSTGRGLSTHPHGTAAGQETSGEADGMILDRVVEGGLDGVENLSPSRELLPLLVPRNQLR